MWCSTLRWCGCGSAAPHRPMQEQTPRSLAHEHSVAAWSRTDSCASASASASARSSRDGNGGDVHGARPRGARSLASRDNASAAPRPPPPRLPPPLALDLIGLSGGKSRAGNAPPPPPPPLSTLEREPSSVPPPDSRRSSRCTRSPRLSCSLRTSPLSVWLRSSGHDCTAGSAPASSRPCAIDAELA